MPNLASASLRQVLRPATPRRENSATSFHHQPIVQAQIPNHHHQVFVLPLFSVDSSRRNPNERAAGQLASKSTDKPITHNYFLRTIPTRPFLAWPWRYILIETSGG
jgi:hypothetical protein